MKRLIVPILLFFSAQLLAEDLIQIYERALESDPQLRAARYSRDSVAEGRPQAIADMLPNLSLTGDITDTYRRTPAGSEGYDSSSATLTLTQPVVNVGHWIALDTAGYNTAKADAEFESARLALMVRVAQAYFNVLSAKDTLSFSRAELRAISRQLEQAKQRFDVGLIAVTAVHEVQAAYDESRANEITAANEVEDAREALREIVNHLSGEGLAGLRKYLPLVKPKPASIETWTQTALERNPDVMAAQNNTHAARRNIAAKRSGHLPTLDLVASATESHTELSTGTDLNSEVVSLQLTVPLFAGGKVLSQTRQARYDFQAATETLEQQRRTVRRQVRNAYRGVVSSISRVRALQAATVSAQSALAATKAGFDVGTRTMVDVLDEQRDLYRARRDYSKARYDYIINGLLLKQAAGSLTQKDLQLVNSLLK